MKSRLQPRDATRGGAVGLRRLSDTELEQRRTGWKTWLLGLALFLFGVAAFRGAVALRLATGGATLALVAVTIQTGSALAAGIGVMLSRSWTRVALAAFGAGAVLQAVMEVFVYRTSAPLAAVGACLGVSAVLIVLAAVIAPELSADPRRPQR